MVRTQVQLAEEDLASLQQMAAEMGVSVSELVRRGVRSVLEGRSKPSKRELLRRSLNAAGVGHSGRTDVSEKHDQYLAEAYEE